MDRALKMKSTIILMSFLVIFGTIFNFLTIKRYIRKRRDEEN
tara:strand:- start:302 stop:427 length:126 start_codon:yes stop_codon:yes gene_type:complete